MADTTTPPDDASELDAVRAKLTATEALIDNYKLIVADYENARKRAARDADLVRKYANEGLARDLLGALDNLDRALDASKKAGESGPLATGVAATAAQFLDVLKRHGVTRMECGPGTPFDPNLHEAVKMEPTNDHAPGEVVFVLQNGFTLHDRVLRPATVVVATAPPEGGSSD
ncbi:MAG TPA: nucleotide exchange factor GrpE [Gemmataceae bacterium]|nr:nucleotide exchange factor GrpE [Gemmataceae bacterium]